MTGKVDIELRTPLIEYSISLRRNITFIKGDSGTGKSYLCNLLEQALEGVEDVTMTVSQSVDCLVLPRVTSNPRISKSWDEIIKSCEDTVIFIDESCDCWKSGIFSRVIQGTSNYYVLISRSMHSDIPYSVDSLLYFDRTITEVSPHIFSRQIISDSLVETQFAPELLITEDEKTGYHLYQYMYDIPVLSAKSKTKINKRLKSLAAQGIDNILVIADGAAFGAEVEQVTQILQAVFQNSYIYLPESFEWVILHSPVFSCIPEIDDVLYKYLDFIDWSIYFSTERYFTEMLSKFTKDLSLKTYDKSTNSLDPVFMQADSIASFRALIPITQGGSPEKTQVF